MSRYLDEMFGLEGQTAIVSGGAGVIGRKMAETLLNAGARVMIWSRTEQSVLEAVNELGRVGHYGKKLQGRQLDSGDEKAVCEGIRKVADEMGQPSIFINAVGGNKGRSRFVEIDRSNFEEVMNLNLLAGLVVPLKQMALHWIDRDIQGAVINLASMTSYKPLSGVWAYNAAKAAVMNLTQAAAREFAESGIRVNAIAPGFFLGKQNRDLLIDRETGEYTARGSEVISRTPFGRFGKTDELAGATLYLASNCASGFVTGVTIPVDGGFLVDNI